MSDEFATVNVRGGDRAREIERLRQHFRSHRDTLTRLAAEAPSERLAQQYQRLVADIDGSLAKLDDLDGRPGSASPTASAAGAAGVAAAVAAPQDPPVSRPHGDPLRGATEPGARPLVGNAGFESERPAIHQDIYDDQGSRIRLAAIVIAGIVVLSLIGWLIWRASSGRDAVPPIVEATETTTAPVTEAAPATIEPVTPQPPTRAASSAAVTVQPEIADYGSVRRGTSAARQIEITNRGASPLSITVSRSKCRCLYYEYAGSIAPGKKETLTVRLDGGRAKPGTLRETIQISSKTDKSVLGTFDVAATVR